MTRAIQPFLIVSQDLATGTPAVIRNLLAAIRRRFPGFLKLRMLMVGCSAGEGDIVLEKQSRDIAWTVEALEGKPDSGCATTKGDADRLQGFPENLSPISRSIAALRVYSRAEHAGHETGSRFSRISRLT